jgi:hypothetical protein
MQPSSLPGHSAVGYQTRAMFPPEYKQLLRESAEAQFARHVHGAGNLT